MAMGPAAPPLPTLPNGCFHRWQEQEELREARALARSVAVTPLRPPEACVGRWCSSHSGSPGSAQFLGYCKRVALWTWGLYAVPLQGTWPGPPHWQSPHDSFFYGPLFFVVPAPQLLVFIHSEHLHPRAHPFLTALYSLSFPPMAAVQHPPP